MKILAVDLATQLGWAQRVDRLINSGTISFKPRNGESPGMRFLNFEGWLRSMIKVNDFDIIAYEQAHLRGAAATEVIVGMIVILKKLCAEYAIEYTDRHTGTIKKFATGHGKASKEDMVNVARLKFPGQKIEDDNQADALHLLSLVVRDLTGENICVEA